MSLPEKPVLRVAMVAGEASGDLLGAGLIKSIKTKHPDAIFFGIGGEQMLAEGFTSIVPMERLAVMGLVEVLSHLWELMGIRHTLFNYILTQHPDVFIGIDAPDFNLGLEQKLHDQGILTVHYVSPSVWAWRQNRIHNIVRSTDLMLTLLPFEAAFYQQHAMRVEFVGHPLADKIPMDASTQQARQQLQINQEDEVIAILPGSRAGEIKYLGEVFIKTAQLCLREKPTIRFIIPCANSLRRNEIENIVRSVAPDAPIMLLDGKAQQAMAAANTILIASGTATLEALLLKKPMVVAYRVSKITYWIAKKMVKTRFISLPNLLANRQVVPEYIQDEATPEKLAHALLEQLQNKAEQTVIESSFREIHHQLKQGANERAAEVVLGLIKQRRSAQQ